MLGIIFKALPPPAKLKTPQWNLLGDTTQSIEIVEDLGGRHGRINEIELNFAPMTTIASDRVGVGAYGAKYPKTTNRQIDNPTVDLATPPEGREKG